ncbi:MAG: PhnD/SsuA/transferrin family substrate-binding protein [Myxococcales bacterium]|nr:PhnD/SsuA/transferrin family substrate-binding protein [Myxococcales bacterium]
MTTLSLGVVAGNERTADALREFGHALEGSTGLSVETCTLPDNEALLAAIAAAELDVAWAPPLVALELQQRQLAEPWLVVQRGFSAGYHSALFVRADSTLHEVADLRSTRVAWVNRDSASGFVAPRWRLRGLGYDPEALFSEERYLGNHLKVAEAVLAGDVDVGATHIAVDPNTGQLRSAPWLEVGADARDVRVIVLIGPIPGDVIVGASRLPVATRQRFTAALLALPLAARPYAEAVFQAHRFDPAPRGHLDLLRGLARDGRR